MTLTALALLLVSQVAVEHPPELGALRAAISEARAKRPTLEALRAMKPGPVEATLAADLAAFDWLDVGAWMYGDGRASLHYDDEDALQYDWFRYLPDGGELRFSLVIHQLDVAKSQVTHTNFEQPPVSSRKVVKLGKATYLQGTAYGEKEHHRVVSYQRGVLVLDVSRDGKPGSKAVSFREVRVAMPKLFESSGK